MNVVAIHAFVAPLTESTSFAIFDAWITIVIIVLVFFMKVVAIIANFTTLLRFKSSAINVTALNYTFSISVVIAIIANFTTLFRCALFTVLNTRITISLV